MPFTLEELWYAAILTATLVAVLLLATAIYQFLIVPARKRRQLDRRLTEEAEHLRRIQILKAKQEQNWKQSLFAKLLGSERYDKLQTFMLQSDIYRDPIIFLSFVLFISAVGLFAGIWALRSILLGFLIGVGLGIFPFVYLKMRKMKKTVKFEKQMPDAMELLARSLRAGHTLPSAIELLGEEMDAPMGTEMKIAYEEQKYGLSVSDSFLHMLQRVDSMDLKYFVSAVLIQQETGGNLAELMENIARVVRSRLNFKAKLRGLTAPARVSAIIMVVTPVVVFFIMLVVAPFYEMILLQSSSGRTMLVVGIVLSLVGSLWLRRLIRSVQT